MALALKAESLWKLYESGESVIKAVEDVSLEVEQGTMVAIMGLLDAEKPLYSTFFLESMNPRQVRLRSTARICTDPMMTSEPVSEALIWASFSKNSTSYLS